MLLEDLHLAALFLHRLLQEVTDNLRAIRRLRLPLPRDRKSALLLLLPRFLPVILLLLLRAPRVNRLQSPKPPSVTTPLIHQIYPLLLLRQPSTTIRALKMVLTMPLRSGSWLGSTISTSFRSRRRSNAAATGSTRANSSSATTPHPAPALTLRPSRLDEQRPPQKCSFLLLVTLVPYDSDCL